jgi:hypothetical protein
MKQNFAEQDDADARHDLRPGLVDTTLRIEGMVPSRSRVHNLGGWNIAKAKVSPWTYGTIFRDEPCALSILPR